MREPWRPSSPSLPTSRPSLPKLRYVQLQLGKLLFTDGRYTEAFAAFEQVKGHEDPRIKREALTGCVKCALRLGDFRHAHADGQLLARSSPNNAESHRELRRRALGDRSLRGCGTEISGCAGDRARQRPCLARHGAKPRRAEQVERRARRPRRPRLARIPRDAEFHHTVGSIYERMRRYEEAANAYSSYINLLPNKDRSAKAAWARAEVRFLRAFGLRPPVHIEPGSEGKLHTVPFRVLNEKIIVKARVNRGPLMDMVLDTGSEQTVISRETAARMGIRPIVNILSAGVGDLGVRELELTRLDQLEIGRSKFRTCRRSSRTRRSSVCRRAKWKASRRWHWGCRSSLITIGTGAHHGRPAAERDR